MDERYFGTERRDDYSAGRVESRGRLNRLFSRSDRENDGYEGSFTRPSYTPPQNLQNSMATSTAGGVVIYSPSTYEDVQLLIDHLKMREQVIVDFSTINQTSVYRILDFMSGAIYALGGSIQQITKNIFLFAPAGVTITVPPQLGRR